MTEMFNQDTISSPFELIAVQRELARAKATIAEQADTIAALSNTSKLLDDVRSELADRKHLRQRIKEAEAGQAFWKEEASRINSLLFDALQELRERSDHESD